jgi:hypothetical protein
VWSWIYVVSYDGGLSLTAKGINVGKRDPITRMDI